MIKPSLQNKNLWIAANQKNGAMYYVTECFLDTDKGGMLTLCTSMAAAREMGRGVLVLYSSQELAKESAMNAQKSCGGNWFIICASYYMIANGAISLNENMACGVAQ